MEEMKLKGTNGLLIVYDDKIIISRKTAMGFMAQGLKGDKVFFYKDISSVEYKKPSFFANGYIKFITAGTNETKQNIDIIGNTTIDALKDANTLILRAFNKEISILSDKIYQYILEKISNKKTEKITNISTADEISKFKQLLDNGTITQEEFENKKKQLLNF